MNITKQKQSSIYFMEYENKCQGRTFFILFFYLFLNHDIAKFRIVLPHGIHHILLLIEVNYFVYNIVNPHVAT